MQAAIQLRDTGRLQEARNLLTTALSIAPGNSDLHILLGTVHEASGSVSEAIDCYRQGLAGGGQNVSFGTVRLATCLAKINDYPQATVLLADLLEQDPHNVSLHQLAANIYVAMKQHGRAVPHLQKALELKPDLQTMEALAQALDQHGQHEQARAAFEQALAKGANRPATLCHLANLELAGGKLDAARNYLDKALDADPNFPHAHMMLANYADIDPADGLQPALAALQHLKQSAAPEEQFPPLHFAIARHYEKQKSYDAAFEHLVQGNDIRATAHSDPTRALCDAFDAHIAAFTPDRLDRNSPTTSPSRQFVFVFGLPRSGTTLIEQILASHPQAASVGELGALEWIGRYLTHPDPNRAKRAADQYLAAIPTALHAAPCIVDKTLNAYLVIGAILAMFPQARFVNCRRHPLDTAISMYSQLFAEGAVAFTSRLDRIAGYYRLYEHAMDHWDRVLPGRVLHVRYEDLVTNPEANARTLVSHAGLDWDPACLDFHKQANTVRTASAVQVRQSVYTTSVSRWRRYETHLDTLKDSLSDLITSYEQAAC